VVSTDPRGRGASRGFEYTYGVLQARVYLPADAAKIADWPAVWADGQRWPRDGEDDLVEGLDGQACFHFHDRLGGPGSCDHALTPGWHTVASDWRPGSVSYYYDGARVGVVSTGVTAAPMYLVLDITVSARAADVTSAAAMRVQYVRVWQRG
jgi:beta-glucanase (GH16 family)